MMIEEPNSYEHYLNLKDDSSTHSPISSERGSY